MFLFGLTILNQIVLEDWGLLALSLTDCVLATFDPLCFGSLENLTELSLWQNNINNLEPKLFLGLKKLKRLVLNKDQLTYHNGQMITQDEFKLCMKVLINPDIKIEFVISYDEIWQE